MPIDAQSDQFPIIVILDASMAVHRQVTGLLRSLPARVIGFTTAREFLAALDAGLQPACLLADLALPDLSTVALLAALKARKRTMPTILLSGDSEIPSTVEAMRAGAISCIEKPYLARFLLEQVAPLIDALQPHGAGEPR